MVSSEIDIDQEVFRIFQVQGLFSAAGRGHTQRPRGRGYYKDPAGSCDWNRSHTVDPIYWSLSGIIVCIEAARVPVDYAASIADILP